MAVVCCQETLQLIDQDVWQWTHCWTKVTSYVIWWAQQDVYKLKTLHKNPYGADDSDPSMRLVQVRIAGQESIVLEHNSNGKKCTILNVCTFYESYKHEMNF